MTGPRRDPEDRVPEPTGWTLDLPPLGAPGGLAATPLPAPRDEVAPEPEPVDDEIRRSLAAVLRAARELRETVAAGDPDGLEWVDVPDDGLGVELDPEDTLPIVGPDAADDAAARDADAVDPDDPDQDPALTAADLAADDPDFAAAPAPAARGLSAGTELLVAFGTALVLERWMSGEIRGFFGIVPSPYWLVVLWLSLRRGLLSGLAAAGAATLLQALGLMVTLQLPGPAALLDLGLLWEPILFFVTAFLTGQIRDANTERQDDLRQSLDAIRAALRDRDADVAALTDTNRALARRLFEQAFDLEGLMRSLGRATSRSEGDVVDLALSMLSEQCGATRCSVLLVLADGTVDLLAERGWDEREIADRLKLAGRSAQVRRALDESRTVIAPREAGGADRGPVMVAPLSDATGVIKALLCVDAMPAERFDETAVQGFVGVAEWVVSALRGVQLGQVRDDARAVVFRAIDDGKTIADSDALAERIHVEDHRRRRYSTPTTLLAIHVREAASVEASESWLSLTLSPVLGPTDDLFRFGYSGCFVAVLTGSDRSAAHDVVRAIGAAAGPEALVVEAFAPDDRHPKLASLLPAITAFFCRVARVALDSRCPVPEPRAGKPGYALQFAWRLRLELELATRLGTEVSLLDFRGSGGESAIGPMIGRHLWNRGEEVLRATDGIFVLSPSRCVVVLPYTDSLDAARIWRRLDSLLRSSVPDGRYEEVESEFLALAGADARSTLEHLLGKPDGGRPRIEGPILTENELRELAFGSFDASAAPAFEEFGVPRAPEPFAMLGAPQPAPAPAPALNGLADVLLAFERIVGDLRDIGGALRDGMAADADGAVGVLRPELDRLLRLCGGPAPAAGRDGDAVAVGAASSGSATPAAGLGAAAECDDVPDNSWLFGDHAVADPWAEPAATVEPRPLGGSASTDRARGFDRAPGGDSPAWSVADALADGIAPDAAGGAPFDDPGEGPGEDPLGADPVWPAVEDEPGFVDEAPVWASGDAAAASFSEGTDPVAALADAFADASPLAWDDDLGLATTWTAAGIAAGEPTGEGSGGDAALCATAFVGVDAEHGASGPDGPAGGGEVAHGPRADGAAAAPTAVGAIGPELVDDAECADDLLARAFAAESGGDDGARAFGDVADLVACDLGFDAGAADAATTPAAPVAPAPVGPAPADAAPPDAAPAAGDGDAIVAEPEWPNPLTASDPFGYWSLRPSDGAASRVEVDQQADDDDGQDEQR